MFGGPCGGKRPAAWAIVPWCVHLLRRHRPVSICLLSGQALSVFRIDQAERIGAPSVCRFRTSASGSEARLHGTASTENACVVVVRFFAQT